MSRPETFTLQCDRCQHEMRHWQAMEARKCLAESEPLAPQRYTSHRQATLDGNAAGWRMTSLEEVCANCVAKESEPATPLRERDPADFDGEAVRAALAKLRALEQREAEIPVEGGDE